MLKNKTTFRLFVLLGVLIFTLVCVSGCLEDGTIKPEIELDIKRSYISTFCNNEVGLDEIIIEGYYGCYNNYHAVLIKEVNKGDTDAIMDIVIGGLTFQYPYSNRSILLWKAGEFISLAEGYENGLIKKDSLTKIHQMFIEKDTANLIDKAREEYLNRYVKSKREDAVIEDVVLDEYLGTYKGVVVCVFSDKKSVFIEPVLQFKIEDLVFTWSYGYDILVYDGTGFMDLQMAYNNSKLTYEDLLNIHKLSQ